jgi:hypothetical protein
MVFDSKINLELDGVRYASVKRIDASNLPDNPVWQRYPELLLNMVIAIVDALGGWLQLLRILRESASKSHGFGT